LGVKTKRALALIGLSKHEYYYCPTKNGNPGVQASTHTIQIQQCGQKLIANNQVIELMKQNNSDLDLCYGYRRMTGYLKLKGYKINHKKVYRLMKEQGLLLEKFKPKGKTYAKYRIVQPKGPLEVIEMDIKFQFIEKDKRYALILTVIDTFTRMVLAWHVAYSIKKHCVKKIWEQVIVDHLQTNNMLNKKVDVEIRNDNDKRFSAKMVQDFFKENYLNQVFTHPYTPQENGHVESFHAILGKSLRQKIFYTLDQLEQHLTLFYEKYNNERIHSSIAMLPPRTFWNVWDKGMVERKINSKNKVKFKLLIPATNISGNRSLEGSILL